MRAKTLSIIVSVAASVVLASPLSATSVGQGKEIARIPAAPVQPLHALRVPSIQKTKQEHAPVAAVLPVAKPLPPRAPSVSAPPQLPIVDQQDIQPAEKALVKDTLEKMDPTCVAAIKNFYVLYHNLPDRGDAGKHTIILSGMVNAAKTERSTEEFRALLLHEFGHVTDLGCIRGSDESMPSGFHDGTEDIPADDPSVDFYSISWLGDQARKPDAEPQDFVSGYAATEPIEEFAETFAYYLTQPEAFRERAAGNPILAAKLAWMEQHVFRGGLTLAKGSAWDGTIPWDVTKLPYTWTAHASDVQTAFAPRLEE